MGSRGSRVRPEEDESHNCNDSSARCNHHAQDAQVWRVADTQRGENEDSPGKATQQLQPFPAFYGVRTHGCCHIHWTNNTRVQWSANAIKFSASRLRGTIQNNSVD